MKGSDGKDARDVQLGAGPTSSSGKSVKSVLLVLASVLLLASHTCLWYRLETRTDQLTRRLNSFAREAMWHRQRRNAADSKQKANVEFIHPKMKEDVQNSESKDPNNPWVWLTSYSRIPLEAIQEFCAATKDYCPAGPKGPKGEPGTPGLIGLKGKRGRPGNPGAKGSQGHRGPIGPPGPRGPKGENGFTGIQGLDGRDGLPGEPGLDGVPGRNGLDGIPGVDGIPGIHGSPGIPGKNGEDGKKGEMGSMGPKGPPGERGLPGPRGRAGENGAAGKAGEPGVGLWVVNTTSSSSSSSSPGGVGVAGGVALASEVAALLVPPRISGGGDSDDAVQAIIVNEGDHLKLSCAAAGVPKPVVSWNRVDGNAFPDGVWQKSNVLGASLNITKVNRRHMGQYVCEANNAIPPSDTQIFEVKVHFSPLIRIHRQMVGGYVGSWVLLECLVEAFPAAVNYWERHDGRLIQHSDKYRLAAKEFDIYKSTVSLNVTLESPDDFGAYYCTAKNEKGVTKGGVTLFERDKNSALPPPLIGGFRPTTIGDEPPPFVGWDDLCPPAPKCPECQAAKCEGAAKIYGLTILPYDLSLPGLPNRTSECMIETIGKPVFHRYSSDLYGSWLMDSLANEENDAKVWETRSEFNQTLFEYVNKTMFRTNIPTRNYTLPFPFTGNDHVVYNGSFFYFHLASESIIRFEMNTRNAKRLKIPRNSIVINYGGDLLTKLYNSKQPDSYFDFSTDENGVWGMFALAEDNNTVVMKFDPRTLDVEYMWNISLNHNFLADSFIVCGVLYGIDHVDERNTRIRLALDLYKNELHDMELPFTNPFSFTTMLGYNPRLQSLATWDGGNQLTYPIKYHAVDYKEEAVEAATEPTGVHVLSSDENEFGLNRQLPAET